MVTSIQTLKHTAFLSSGSGFDGLAGDRQWHCLIFTCKTSTLSALAQRIYIHMELQQRLHNYKRSELVDINRTAVLSPTFFSPPVLLTD